MLLVVDANSVIGLSKGGVFHLLPKVFRRICLPQSIWDELVVVGRGRPGQAEAESALASGWLEVVPTLASALFARQNKLTRNDADLVQLALDLKPNFVLSDDKGLRRALGALRIGFIGTPVVVVALRRVGLIDSCKDVLDQMILNGFGIAPNLYDDALLQSGEVL